MLGAIVIGLVAATPAPLSQAPKPTLLSVAFVRLQDPDEKAAERRGLTVELYPIALHNKGQWTEAAPKGRPGDNSRLRSDARFTIYKGGAPAGWIDITQVQERPYLDTQRWVGLGGWSLPKELHPSRIASTSGRHYLTHSLYTWVTGDKHVSIQPFLAADEPLPRRRAPSFSEPVVNECRGILADWVLHRRRELFDNDKGGPLVLQDQKIVDLDDDLWPEVLAFYSVPDESGDARTFVAFGHVRNKRFSPLYEEVTFGQVEALDVLDVNGDGWQEVVMAIRDEGSVKFAVVQRVDGRFKRVFLGSGFAKAK